MVSFKSLFVAAASFAVAIAQTSVAFSSVPPVAVAGSTYNITWGGGDGSPVTLTLRQGQPQNLATIKIIASQVSGDSYEWTVPTDIPSASDYALQILQGVDGVNYSGEFAIVGGTGSSSISYSGFTSATASSSMNVTAITTMGSTAARTTASMGTGTAMMRNTTFSHQSLSSALRTTTTAASTFTAAASTTIAQQASSPSGNAGSIVGSSAGLIMGLFGAIVFLH